MNKKVVFACVFGEATINGKIVCRDGSRDDDDLEPRVCAVIYSTYVALSFFDLFFPPRKDLSLSLAFYHCYFHDIDSVTAGGAQWAGVCQNGDYDDITSEDVCIWNENARTFPDQSTVVRLCKRARWGRRRVAVLCI